MAGFPATYVDADTFTVRSDHTDDFVANRRVKAYCGVDGYKYGTVESSSYADPLTTVNMLAANDDLTINLTKVWYGEQSSGSSGTLPIHSHDGTEGSGGEISEFATITEDIDMDDTYQITNLQAPAAAGEAIRATANITEAALTELTDGSDTTEHDHDGISENTSARQSVYCPDATADDQGVTGDGATIKAYVDTIDSDNAVIYLKNTKGSTTTTYTLTTSETIPSNIKLVAEPGVVIDGAGTLTISGMFEVGPDGFGSTLTVSFGATAKGIVTPHMWDTDVSLGSIDASVAINKMIASLPSSGAVKMYYPNGTYKLDNDINTEHPVHGWYYPVDIEMAPGVIFTGTGEAFHNITNVNNTVSGGMYKKLDVTAADGAKIVSAGQTSIQTGNWEAVSETGCDCYVAAGYFGARANPGSTGDIWAINTLIELIAGSTGNGIANEVDVSNYTTTDNRGYGVVVNGAGSSLKGTAFDVLSNVNATSDWTSGVRVQDFVTGIAVSGATSNAPVIGVHITGMVSNHLVIKSSADADPTHAHAYGTDSGDNPMWSLRKGGTVWAKNGFTLDAQAITEFSTDGTLADNSNAALPTEAAVKTYVGKPKADIDMDGNYQVVGLQAPAAAGEAIRQTANITETNLTTLTDNSIADTLHRHSELVASDGDPDPALSVDATGNLTQPAGLYIATDEIRAVDGGGLLLRDDSGTSGIFIEDGGCVGVGTSTPTEKFEVAPDTDISGVIGKAHIGYMGLADFAGFSHVDMDGSASYALLQGSDGTTYLNAVTGKKIEFRNNSAVSFYLDASAFYGAAGKIIAADSFRISATASPASNDTGTAGDIAWDTGYFYVCTAANTWERVALTGGY